MRIVEHQSISIELTQKIEHHLSEGRQIEHIALTPIEWVRLCLEMSDCDWVLGRPDQPPTRQCPAFYNGQRVVVE